MPKNCDKCDQPFGGFGSTCGNCRKGAAHDAWDHCTKCSAHFKGHGLCPDCKAGIDPFAKKTPSCKVVKEPAGKCFECGKEIGYAESISSKGKEYHPDCFRCHKCKKMITGIHKVESDGHTKTCQDCMEMDVCEGCKKPLGSSQTTIMQGKKYHPECLKCDACGKLLTNKFCPYEGHLLCTKCGDNPKQALAAARPKDTLEKADDTGKKDYCEVCHKECKDAYLRAQGKQYHQECFKCQGCNKPLGEKFFPIDGKIFCAVTCQNKRGGGGYPGGEVGTRSSEGVGPRSTLQPDDAVRGRPSEDRDAAVRRVSPKPSTGAGPRTSPRALDVADAKCGKCGHHIDSNKEPAIKAMGKHWHKECFTCSTCKAELGEIFYPCGKNFLCKMCGEEETTRDLPTCSQCKQRINGQFKKMDDGKVLCTKCSPADECAACSKKLTGKYLDFDGLKFHNECFKCEGCSKGLAGQSIYTGSKQQRFCQGCADAEREKTHAETVGMCMKCGKVLSGKYMIAEDMKFHKDCFTCDKCGSRIDGSYSVEEPSGRFALKVNNQSRKKFICEKCD